MFPQFYTDYSFFSYTPAAVPGVNFSDHLNDWKYKFPAVMITNTAFFRNPHYHLPSGRIETLNFDKMAEVVRGVYWAVVHLDSSRALN